LVKCSRYETSCCFLNIFAPRGSSLPYIQDTTLFQSKFFLQTTGYTPCNTFRKQVNHIVCIEGVTACRLLSTCNGQILANLLSRCPLTRVCFVILQLRFAPRPSLTVSGSMTCARTLSLSSWRTMTSNAARILAAYLWSSLTISRCVAYFPAHAHLDSTICLIAPGSSCRRHGRLRGSGRPGS
jgi:hypothetical protein